MSDGSVLPADPVASHHLGCSQMRVQIGDVTEIELRIRIRVEDRLVATSGKAIDQSTAVAPVLWLGHGPNPCIPLAPFLQNLGSRIGGTIVDDDQLPSVGQLLESRDRLRDRGVQDFLLVVGRHQGRELWNRLAHDATFLRRDPWNECDRRGHWWSDPAPGE